MLKTLFNTLFPKPPEAVKKPFVFKACPHINVEIRTVYPITHNPKSGVCKTCGERVTAKLIWVAK